MADARNRSISLPVDPLDAFKRQAASRDMSVSAWLVEAGERQLRREWAAAAVAFSRQPEIAEQLAEIDAYFAEQDAAFDAEMERRAA